MNVIKFLFKKIANISKIFSRKGLNKFISTEVSQLNNRQYNALTVGAGGDTESLIKVNKNINLISISILMSILIKTKSLTTG